MILALRPCSGLNRTPTIVREPRPDKLFADEGAVILTRKDIAEMSIRTVAAFLTSVAVVGGGIGLLVSMASGPEAQQEKVLSLSAAVLQFQIDVRALVEAQENYATKDDIEEILNKWLLKQTGTSTSSSDTEPASE